MRFSQAKKEPVKIRELKPEKRSANFDEVVLGYVDGEALKEASRCLHCKNPACLKGCPVGINIKKFIHQITKKDYEGAYFTIREKNVFPSICGRVCPAEYQCRRVCVLTKKGSAYSCEAAINIHFLERFIGDYAITHKLESVVKKDEKFSKFKVAVIGSGPAGLCCAGELTRRGIRAVVFESLHALGGVLRYGIPSFRLPGVILDFEIDYLRKMGVQFIPNLIIGKTKSLESFFEEGFSAAFLGLGAGIPSFLGIKGESLCNIYSANEFLTRVNLMRAHEFPKFHTPVNIGAKIIIIGGGNTAIDAARVAIRLQKKNKINPDTTIVYRRTELEMPARRLEIEHAKEEGVKFAFLVRPLEFTGGDKGFVRKLKCLKCALGEPDSSGRRKPVDIKGSSFEIDCDLAVIAVGLRANEILSQATPELKIDEKGDIIVNPDTMETSIKRVYAGGDIVGGEGTVIEAMGMAKKAARAIIEYLSLHR